MTRRLDALAAGLAALVVLTACRPTPTVRATTPMDVSRAPASGSDRPLDRLYWQASVLPAETLRRTPGR